MYQHNQQSGRVSPLPYLPSPNHNARPSDSHIEVLVIHAISLPPQCYDGDYIEALFTNRLDCTVHPAFVDLQGLTVSAHFYIRRNGRVTQFVPTHRRAWHAGKSEFQPSPTVAPRRDVNDFSIGIELEGCDAHAFMPVQYRRLIALSTCLLRAFPAMAARRENIVGHSAIAAGRKTDPGPHFDWDYYLASLPLGVAAVKPKFQV